MTTSRGVFPRILQQGLSFYPDELVYGIGATSTKLYRVHTAFKVALTETPAAALTRVVNSGALVVADQCLGGGQVTNSGGNFFLASESQIPTEDPGIDGAAWLDNGALTISSGPAPASPLSDGLIDGLDFEEASGNLTSFSGATFTKISLSPDYDRMGPIGKAIGAQQGHTANFQCTAGVPLIDFGSSFTVVLLGQLGFIADPGGAEQSVVSFSMESDNGAFELRANTNLNAVGANIYDGIAEVDVTVSDPDTDANDLLASGAYHLLVGGFNSATSELFFSLDDHARVTGDATGMGTNISNNTAVNAYSDDDFSGWDYCLIYDRVLTEQEVLDLWNSGSFFQPPFTG